MKKIHVIAIGGSVMHDLAIDLKEKGYEVTGSDDEFFEPSKSRLAQHGLLPTEQGWHPERIDATTDAVVLGMHARPDNPELQKAQALNIPIYSYPAFIYEQCKDKQRVVIAGSHGKTTITAMVMHVLQFNNRLFDYVIGASVEGFEKNIRLSHEAPVVIIEGDEYLSSPIDATPKFLHYQHHIGVITGIVWDHVNVYPTFESYIDAFEKFAEASPKAGALIFSQDDDIAALICKKERNDVWRYGYKAHAHEIKEGITYLNSKEYGKTSLEVFGEHNLRNIMAAKVVCERIGIKDEQFYKAISTFKGAKKRLEKIASNAHTTIYRDFAHAPSKVLATTQAVKQQFPQRKLVACLELHSFSSLNKNFLPHYKNHLQAADLPIVYFNPKTVAHKNLPELTAEDIRSAFEQKNLMVFDNMDNLQDFLLQQNWSNANLLLMSSGSFDNYNFQNLTHQICTPSN